MTRNVGTLDRWLRAVAITPAAIVAALLIGPATAGGVVLFVVGAVMLVTAMTGFCPLYRLLHINTYRQHVPQP